MRREACAGCGGSLLDFLNLGSTPPADSFPETAAIVQASYPLVAAVCTSCLLAQLRDVLPGSELFGVDYGFRTGASPGNVRYFADLVAQLIGRYRAQAQRLVVEIACNDGTLLQHFAGAGYHVIGVEPAEAAAAETAKRIDLDALFMAPFSAQLGADMRDAYGPAGLVIACNVAAHVADPRDFLAGIAALLHDDGIAVIEFQDVTALIAGCQYDHVYHEHRFFYSLRTFSELAGRAGLMVTWWEPTPAQGGSLRVYLRKGRGGFIHGDPWLQDMAVYQTMQARADYSRRALRGLLEDELDAGRTVAGYGASAKSCTLLNFCGITSREVAWVEDITPGKIGRVTPGSKIPVRAPGERPDTYLLLSWNYAGAILRREATFLAAGGRFIIPGAVPVLL